MNTRKTRIAALVLAVCLSGTAQASLQGRDLNGSIDSFEAYYDTDLNITWLADANHAQTSGYDADGRMNWNGDVGIAAVPERETYAMMLAGLMMVVPRFSGTEHMRSFQFNSDMS